MRSILTGFGIVLAVAAPIAAQGTLIQSPEGRGLALVVTNEGVRIEDPAGSASSATSIEVPQGTLLSDFHELADGWIAAGHRWTDGGSELVLLRQTGQQIERVEPPARAGDAFRIAPVPLIEKGRLSGLAWLEGDSGEKNAVMASRWTGSDWEAIGTVSPMTGEAQLALSGAVLDDGSHLLVWAAVDGGDDEVFWSRLQAGEWSAPARIHPDNDVPDVVPKVVAVAGGALVAWSQYDGKDYRLRVARFAAGSWTDTGILSEEGSLYPTLFPTTRGAGFLYQTASPPSWSLIEVEADGRLRHRTAMSRRGGERKPLVSTNEADSVRLRFVAESTVDKPTPESISWHQLDWIEQP